MVPFLAALLLADLSALAESGSPELFVGTSLFSLYDLFPDSPEFLQLDLGYRLSESDVLLLEALTWKYSAPTGIFEGSGAGPAYPGYIKSYGVSVAYQRFLWNGLFARVHASSFLQDYRDAEGDGIQQGFQLMLQFRLGYRLEFRSLGQRLYIEPNADCNYWPLNLNVPAAFAEADSHYPNFAFEPGLNFGLSF